MENEKDKLEKLRELAHRERKKEKHVIDEGLGNYLKGERTKPVRLRKEKNEVKKILIVLFAVVILIAVPCLTFDFPGHEGQIPLCQNNKTGASRFAPVRDIDPNHLATPCLVEVSNWNCDRRDSRENEDKFL